MKNKTLTAILVPQNKVGWNKEEILLCLNTYRIFTKGNLIISTNECNEDSPIEDWQAQHLLWIDESAFENNDFKIGDKVLCPDKVTIATIVGYELLTDGYDYCKVIASYPSIDGIPPIDIEDAREWVEKRYTPVIEMGFKSVWKYNAEDVIATPKLSKSGCVVRAKEPDISTNAIRFQPKKYSMWEAAEEYFKNKSEFKVTKRKRDADFKSGWQAHENKSENDCVKFMEWVFINIDRYDLPDPSTDSTLQFKISGKYYSLQQLYTEWEQRNQ